MTKENFIIVSSHLAYASVDNIIECGFILIIFVYKILNI